MRPTLVELFGLQFHSYVTIMSAAFLFCTFAVLRDLRKLDPPIYGSTRGGFWTFLGVLLGAKIFWILQYDTPLNIWRAVIIWEGGMVFYGGLIGGIVALCIYVPLQKAPLLVVADVIAPYIALGEGLGRLGCYLNGCCWGLPTSVPWAVCFPKGSHAFREQVKQGLLDPAAAGSLPVHPTQLYMLAGLVLIFFVLRTVRERPHRHGMVFLLYFSLYGMLRFIVEIFREGSRPLWGMTLSQILSLLLVVGSIGAGGLVRYWIGRRKNMMNTGISQ